jgi:two-component system CheB/CheR fusion protein
MLDSDKTTAQLVAELTAARRRIALLEAAQAHCAPDPPCERTNSTADFYLSILNDAPALIWRSGRDAKCDWFNATWLAFTGRTMQQEYGDGWAQGVHPDDFDACLKTYLTAFHAREFFEMEYRLRHHSGAYRWIIDIGCPFYEPDGSFGGYIGYCYDITQRKQDERFRLDVERIIRHDIKSPLHALSALAQVLFDDIVDKEIQPLLPRLSRAIDNVIDLVDSTEKLLLIERGQYRPPAVRLPLDDILRDATASLEDLATSRRTPVLLVASDAPEPNVVCGDRVLLQTLFTNCIKNAVEASPPGQTVHIAQVRDRDAVRVSIHNSGAIPESIRANFFDKYVTCGKSNGTGLGTYSASIIAKAHGGGISFVTSEAEGTTITVALPPAAPDAPAPCEPRASSA